MSNKVLTVSVAAYNVAPFLTQCLDSLASCRRKDLLEVLIVDDGSTDETAKIARAYCEREPEVFRLIQKENGGWGSTLNASIPEARGTYFRQLDGDDLLNTETLDRYLECLEEESADLVLTPYETFVSGTEAFLPCESSKVPKAQGADISLLPSGYSIPMHTCTFRTSLLQDEGVHLLEHCFYTDTEFVVKGIRQAETFSSYPEPLYRYRVARRGQSVSREGYRQHRQELVRVAMELVQTFNKETFTNKEAAETRILEHLSVISGNLDAFSRAEFMDYEKELKSKAPAFYAAERSRAVLLLRRTGYLLWGPMVLLTGALRRREEGASC